MTRLFRIKICGITSVADALAVAEAGADAIGLNFYSGSRRCATPEAAQAICRELGAALTKVGVFVNEDPRRIVERQAEVGLDVAQLHGDETPDDVASLAGIPVIKAFRAAGDLCERVMTFVGACQERKLPLAGVLIDAYRPGEYGGTGETVDWKTAKTLRESLVEVPLILAGGLTPDNVADAIAAVRPHGVDTASGVESSPGVKDAARVRAFVRAARGAL